MKYSAAYKALNREVGKAIHHYAMISEGDRIAVGVSGGKDSLSLLWVLNERQTRVPVRYELAAIYVDPGFEGGSHQELEDFCGKMGIRLRVDRTNHGILGHSPENKENPCFLCSRLRRKRLFEITEELGCNKLALGHTKDDIIETLFLNICYAGEISTMIPSQTFFKGKFSLIRPLAFVDEEVTRRFSAEARFPVFTNPCPTASVSKRHEIKKLLYQLYRTNRKIKGNIFNAMHHINPEYMLHSK
jgi:tRNA 2-thiocytidine biosynthesis protein TtcA